MQVAEVRYLTIHFNDGSSRSYMFEKAQEQSTAMSRLQQTLEQGLIILEFGDKLEMVPISAVKSVEISPKPDFHAISAIHVVEEVD